MEVGEFLGYADEYRFALTVLGRTLLEPAFHAEDPARAASGADSAPLRHLRQYLAILAGAGGVGGDPALRALVGRMLTDLVALALDVRAAAAGTSIDVRAARLCAIKADIAKNINRGRLSVKTIASRHRVTPRYVQMLFAAEGTTFTQFVLESRLARAHRMLADPRFADRSITAVAFDVGFGDVSYFNRCFRRRFGVTPSQVRAEAQCNNGHDRPTQCASVVGAQAEARMRDVEAGVA